MPELLLGVDAFVDEGLGVEAGAWFCGGPGAARAGTAAPARTRR